MSFLIKISSTRIVNSELISQIYEKGDSVIFFLKEAEEKFFTLRNTTIDQLKEWKPKEEA